jgi:hypothetical protein
VIQLLLLLPCLSSHRCGCVRLCRCMQAPQADLRLWHKKEAATVISQQPTHISSGLHEL